MGTPLIYEWLDATTRQVHFLKLFGRKKKLEQVRTFFLFAKEFVVPETSTFSPFIVNYIRIESHFRKTKMDLPYCCCTEPFNCRLVKRNGVIRNFYWGWDSITIMQNPLDGLLATSLWSILLKFKPLADVRR